MKFGNKTDAANIAVLDALCDAFADAVKKKMHDNYFKGRRGWDDHGWSLEEIKGDLHTHIAKGDPRDVAIYAAFWWNRVEES